MLGRITIISFALTANVYAYLYDLDDHDSFIRRGHVDSLSGLEVRNIRDFEDALYHGEIMRRGSVSGNPPPASEGGSRSVTPQSQDVAGALVGHQRLPEGPPQNRDHSPNQSADTKETHEGQGSSGTGPVSGAKNSATGTLGAQDLETQQATKQEVTTPTGEDGKEPKRDFAVTETSEHGGDTFHLQIGEVKKPEVEIFTDKKGEIYEHQRYDDGTGQFVHKLTNGGEMSWRYSSEEGISNFIKQKRLTKVQADSESSQLHH